MGEVVAEEWTKSGTLRREVHLDAFVVMPDHIHGIVGLVPAPLGMAQPVPPWRWNRGDRPVAPAGPAPRSLGAFIAGFKSAVTVQVNRLRGSPGAPIWQRNYHEHVVRSMAELHRIRTYILLNPVRWVDP